MANAAGRPTITPIHPHFGARVGVIWDNRAVLHRGLPWDASRHRRVMRRTTVAGEGPTADPPFAARAPARDGIVPARVGA